MHVPRTTIRTILVFANLSLLSAAAQAQTIWFVDDDGAAGNGCTSWADACPELQTALSLAEGNDQIWVAKGTYRPDFPAENSPGPAFELVDGVTLYGGFQGNETGIEDRAELFEETILSGNLPNGNSFHILMGEDLQEGAVVDGFTITGARASGFGFVHDRGGGLFLFNSKLDVRHCRFVENSAWNVAGGAWISESIATFTSCIFKDNAVFPSSGGAAIHNVFGSHVTLIDCRISGHTIGGGAIFVGGNILGNLAGTLIAHRTVFVGNSGVAGGAIINNGFATIVNSLFVGNEVFGPGTPPFAGKGGAIANFGEMSITNSTLFGNKAAVAGGGLHNVGETSNTNLDSILVVSNCVLWGNIAPGSLESAQVSSDGDELSVNYSDIEGLTGDLGGLGNIDSDPLFVDPLGPDGETGTGDELLRLFSASPAIDAGDNTALPAEIVVDLDGNARFVDDPVAPDSGNSDGTNAAVDMGAYEFICIDDGGDGWMTICHVPPGHPDNANTITVRISAIPAHRSHGDYCGYCREDLLDDCNFNLVPDAVDIADGTSQDCDDNEIPDECDFDCNENGVVDNCDIAGGTSDDCNTNSIPDECEPECNGNGRPDVCDIAEGTSVDCDENGVPDECEPDCNENSQTDACDIADGTSDDCDGNSVPDECEPDCNDNGQTDACDITDGSSHDCDSNGVPDECDPDCNGNGQTDACDIAEGVSEDCNGNGVPDECDPDCNANGQPDECDIEHGLSEDCNLDGVPDDCVPTPLITSQPEDQEAQPGDMVLFGITAEGFVLGYQWRKDGVELVDTERIIGTNGTLLVILEVVPSDAGVYDCVVTDLLLGCQSTSDPATLTVIEPRSSGFRGRP